jgi:hypothetical protein
VNGDATAWLQRPEIAGTEGLNEPYPFDKDQDPPEYSAAEMVFARGFDPLAGGIEFGRKVYEGGITAG